MASGAATQLGISSVVQHQHGCQRIIGMHFAKRQGIHSELELGLGEEHLGGDSCLAAVAVHEQGVILRRQATRQGLAAKRHRQAHLLAAHALESFALRHQPRGIGDNPARQGAPTSVFQY